jgi:hypothetical protein
MHPILARLQGGDRRSIGHSTRVVVEVLRRPRLFGVLVRGMEAEDPLVRMRAADVVEKVSAIHPEYLQPHKLDILDRISRSEQQEVRWHVAQICTRLPLNRNDRRKLARILQGYLDDSSRIVQVFSMQALADLTLRDPGLRVTILPRLKILAREGSPAVRNRGRKLLQILNS